MKEGIAAMAAIVALSACHGAPRDDGSASDLALGALDDGDAPDDAYVSPRRNGWGPGIPDLAVDAAQAPQPDLAGAPMVNEAVCNGCEMKNCRNLDGNDWYAYCFLNTAPNFADLCLEVLRCARKTGCADVDPEACYCGAGVSDVVCLGSPMGPCINEFEAAAMSSHVSDVIDRLSDPSYPVGAAFNLLRYCEVPVCGAVCTVGANFPDGGGAPDLASSPPDLAHAPDLSQPATQLRNGRFDSDISFWSAEYGAFATFIGPPDASGSTSSGSMQVGNTTVVPASGVTMSGAEQCVPALAGTFTLAAKVLIASGQSAGSAGVAVEWFASSDCSGAIASVWSSDEVSATGSWSGVAGSFATPGGAGSMKVRLVVTKSFGDPILKVQFDDVTLVKQ
jgi:hypothetical protein